MPKAILDLVNRQDIEIDDLGFHLATALNKVEGSSFIRKFSYVPGLALATGERDLWEFGSPLFGNVNMTFPADGTAPVDSISCSATGQTSQVLIIGLDIDGNEVSQVVALNGQTRVALTTPLWRVNRALRITPSARSDRFNALPGNVYIFANTALTLGVPNDPSKVIAFIATGSNQTRQSFYTVPKGKSGLFLAGSIRIIKKGTGAAIAKVYVRTFGGPCINVQVGSISNAGSSSVYDPQLIPETLPEKSDIFITADVDSNDTGASHDYIMLLLDNGRFKL